MNISINEHHISCDCRCRLNGKNIYCETKMIRLDVNVKND